jgi:hypothetical protein
MSDNVVMRVKQRNVVWPPNMAGPLVKHDSVTRAGLDYIGGAHGIHDIDEAPEDERTDKGIYIPELEGPGKVYINKKYGE